MHADGHIYGILAYMSSRYALYEIDKLRDRFTLASGVPKGVKPHYNISATHTIPVIVNRDGKNEAELMKWGHVPTGAKDMNSVFRYKTQATRSEGIFEKSTWKQAIREQRCLIPANGFYEWKRSSGGKHPFYITATDQSLFGFAGVYSSWTDPTGVTWGTCALITTRTEATSDLIPSRLPIIVAPEDEADWLNPDINDINTLYRIMRPYDQNHLRIHKVSDDINGTKPNSAHLIKRVASI